MSEEENKEIEDKSAADEIQRLKFLETENNTIRQQLNQQVKKNQENEQVFLRVSGLLNELLALSHRTTYVATMVRDIVDNRNATTS